MKRREFIRNTSIGAVGTLFIPEFLKQINQYKLEQGFKRLVVIQLSGGNDGLNTVIPYRNDIYYQSRPQIGVVKSDVLKLSDELGFNNKLKAFHELYQDGYVSVLNAVGYPNPNRSHFRSMDIWQSGLSSSTYSKTGWIGRYLDNYCKDSHEALELDSQLSLSLQGLNKNGIALESSDRLFNALRANAASEFVNKIESESLSEDNMGYLYKTLIQTNQSAEYLKETHNVKDNNTDFPRTKLGKALANVSQFIRSDYNTQVYYVSHNGYDSHVNQRNSQDRLLEDYGNSVKSFVTSLEKSGDFENTLILTFSEFGRRVKENASRGTDHGKANVAFLIGKNLKKAGIYNSEIDLVNQNNGDLQYQIDFRNIYSDILRDWLDKDPSDIIDQKFDSLGII